MILSLYLIFYLAFRFTKKISFGMGIFLTLACGYAFLCVKFGQRHMEITLFIFGMVIALVKEKYDALLKKHFLLMLLGSFVLFFGVYMIYVRSVIMGRFVLPGQTLNLLIVLSDMAIVIFVTCACYFFSKKGIPVIVNPVSRWFSKYSLEIYGLQTMFIYLLLAVFGKTVWFVLSTAAATIVASVLLKTLAGFMWKLICGRGPKKTE